LFGKFVSDSVEFVMGASEIIGKTAGVIALIAISVVTLSPIIKIFVIIVATSVISAIAESLNIDEKIVKLIDGFCSVYKTVIGVLIGTSVTFVISIAVIISLMGKVVS